MTTGVLLMAYGSPDTLDDVAPYLRDIRAGRAVSDAAVEELTGRYAQIGVPSPLLATTRAQARALSGALGEGFTVAVGMKHWQPWIVDGVRELSAASVDRIVGIAAAPHYATISIDGYAARVEAAIESTCAGIPFRMVRQWYDQPAFISLVARNIAAALEGWPTRGTKIFFSAHSLPARIIEQGDPYRDQLVASSEAVIARAGRDLEWESTFQSASATGEPWLGPDLLERIDAHADAGGERALVVPIGFVADHLEILFDIDVQAAERAAARGVELRRVRSPNADPALAEAMAAAIRGVLP
jgi:protoporphyrin/coproporphyrin ferrochelatase